MSDSFTDCNASDKHDELNEKYKCPKCGRLLRYIWRFCFFRCDCGYETKWNTNYWEAVHEIEKTCKTKTSKTKR